MAGHLFAFCLSSCASIVVCFCEYSLNAPGVSKKCNTVKGMPREVLEWIDILRDSNKTTCKKDPERFHEGDPLKGSAVLCRISYGFKKCNTVKEHGDRNLREFEKKQVRIILYCAASIKHVCWRNKMAAGGKRKWRIEDWTRSGDWLLEPTSQANYANPGESTGGLLFWKNWPSCAFQEFA